MKVLVKIYAVVVLGIVVMLGGGGWYLYIVSASRQSINPTIAFILQSGVSASAFVRSVRDAADLFSQVNQTPIKRYSPDGSAADALRVLKQIYADGIRKVVGPLTSGELDENVQQFIADHQDMIVITPSATNPAIGSKIHMQNFFRFIAPDDILAKMYIPFMMARVHGLKNLMILSRDDAWGRALTKTIQQNAQEKFKNIDVLEFFYTVPEKFAHNEEFVAYFSGIVQRMRDTLKKSNGPTAIMTNTFAEINQYAYLVHNDPLFAVPHFGSDSLVYSGIPFEDVIIAKFLADVKFEILVFFADNALSTKRFVITEQLILQQKKYNMPLLMPSLHAFTAYDALQCLSLCKTRADLKRVIASFYGTTGFIELNEQNNRVRGSFLGVGVIFDGTAFRWMPLSLSKSDVYVSDAHVLDRIFIDLSASYEISWDKSWHVEVELIGFDLTDKAHFKPKATSVNAKIGSYVVLYCNDGERELKFMVYPALASDGAQVYVNLLTKDQWTKQAMDSLYLGAKADGLVVKKGSTDSSIVAAEQSSIVPQVPIIISEKSVAVSMPNKK